MPDSHSKPMASQYSEKMRARLFAAFEHLVPVLHKKGYGGLLPSGVWKKIAGLLLFEAGRFRLSSGGPPWDQLREFLESCSDDDFESLIIVLKRICNEQGLKIGGDTGMNHLLKELGIPITFVQEQLVKPTPNEPSARNDQATELYAFHPEIEKVSGQLFHGGHYKQAALEAYIRVIAEVRNRSNLNDDGDSLMNRAFSCSKHQPRIQFNALQTDAERDEQMGLFYLYKGVVGLRNAKAHSNTLFNDYHRAYEYLGLASLLLRLLEIAKVNPSSSS